MKPSSYEKDKQHAFDSFCKKVLKHEACDYHDEMKRRRERETSFSTLSMQEMEQLSVMDDYPSDNYIFRVVGYDIAVKNDLLAEALEALPEQKRNIVLLHDCIGLSDKEIGELLNVVRRTVHYQRTSSLQELKNRLEGKINV